MNTIQTAITAIVASLTDANIKLMVEATNTVLQTAITVDLAAAMDYTESDTLMIAAPGISLRDISVQLAESNYVSGFSGTFNFHINSMEKGSLDKVMTTFKNAVEDLGFGTEDGGEVSLSLNVTGSEEVIAAVDKVAHIPEVALGLATQGITYDCVGTTIYLTATK